MRCIKSLRGNSLRELTGNFLRFNRELSCPIRVVSDRSGKERLHLTFVGQQARSSRVDPATDVGPGETHRLLGTLCRHLCGLIQAKDEAPARDGLLRLKGNHSFSDVRVPRLAGGKTRRSPTRPTV